jgi:hypothetical protein
MKRRDTIAERACNAILNHFASDEYARAIANLINLGRVCLWRCEDRDAFLLRLRIIAAFADHAEGIMTDDEFKRYCRRTIVDCTRVKVTDD